MIPLTRQREIVQDQMHMALPFLLDVFEERGAALERMAMNRLDEGFEVFGDAVFTRAAGRIEAELDEELADALVYACSLLWRRYSEEAA